MRDAEINAGKQSIQPKSNISWLHRLWRLAKIVEGQLNGILFQPIKWTTEDPRLRKHNISRFWSLCTGVLDHVTPRSNDERCGPLQYLAQGNKQRRCTAMVLVGALRRKYSTNLHDYVCLAWNRRHDERPLPYKEHGIVVWGGRSKIWDVLLQLFRDRRGIFKPASDLNPRSFRLPILKRSPYSQ